MREGGYSKQAQAASFRELMRRKRAFLVPTVVFVSLFFIMLPILSIFTDALDGKVIGAISWAYLYAFAQFLLAWIVAFLYWREANRWDKLTRKAREEGKRGERSA